MATVIIPFGLLRRENNQLQEETIKVRAVLLEDCGGDTLRRDGILHDADLLDGRVVLALP